MLYNLFSHINTYSMSQFGQSSFQVFNRLRCLRATVVDKTETEPSRASKVWIMKKVGSHQRAGVAGKEVLRGRAHGKTKSAPILTLGKLTPVVWLTWQSIIKESYAVYRKLALKMEAVTNYEKNNYGSIKHNHSILIGLRARDPRCHYRESINAVEQWKASPTSRNPGQKYFRFQNFQDLGIFVYFA